MKSSLEPELKETEQVADLTEMVTLSAIGNGQYEVRLRIAGLDKSQLIRVPATAKSPSQCRSALTCSTPSPDGCCFKFKPI